MLPMNHARGLHSAGSTSGERGRTSRTDRQVPIQLKQEDGGAGFSILAVALSRLDTGVEET